MKSTRHVSICFPAFSLEVSIWPTDVQWTIRKTFSRTGWLSVWEKRHSTAGDFHVPDNSRAAGVIRLRKYVRTIGLWHLPPHQTSGLIQLIWLARRVSPFSLCLPSSLLELRTKGDDFVSRVQQYCALWLEPPNNLPKFKRERKGSFIMSPNYWIKNPTSNWAILLFLNYCILQISKDFLIIPNNPYTSKNLNIH